VNEAKFLEFSKVAIDLLEDARSPIAPFIALVRHRGFAFIEFPGPK
jgi:hypothetical protein